MRRSFDIAPDTPLSGLRGFVYGAGPLGLFTALALARNGAEVTLGAANPIERGVGFANAPGLIQPIASADRRIVEFAHSALRFCEWARPDPAWGVEVRRVLFLSDSEAKVEQEWMTKLPSYRRAAADELGDRRPYGACFDAYVLQPDIALGAFDRELRLLGVEGPKEIEVRSAADAAQTAREAGADFFVLALGLGLAKISDIEHVAGPNAMLQAGVGVTIVIPDGDIGLDHVIWDDVDVGYLIPQRTQVIAGGTNVLRAHDDAEALVRSPDEELVDIVRGKIARLWAPAAKVAGEPKTGNRPVRAGGKLLLATLDPPDVPILGLVIGGAGGRGWALAVGTADAVTREVACTFDRTGTARLAPGDTAEEPGRTTGFDA